MRPFEKDERVLRALVCQLGSSLGIAIPFRRGNGTQSLAQEINERIIERLNKNDSRVWKFFGPTGSFRNFIRHAESFQKHFQDISSEQELASVTSMLQGTGNTVKQALEGNKRPESGHVPHGLFPRYKPAAAYGIIVSRTRWGMNKEKEDPAVQYHESGPNAGKPVKPGTPSTRQRYQAVQRRGSDEKNANLAATNLRAAMRDPQARAQRFTSSPVSYRDEIAVPVLGKVARIPSFVYGDQYKLTRWLVENYSRPEIKVLVDRLREARGGRDPRLLRSGKEAAMIVLRENALNAQVYRDVHYKTAGTLRYEREDLVKILTNQAHLSNLSSEHKRHLSQLAEKFRREKGSHALTVAGYKQFLEIVRKSQSARPGDALIPFGQHGTTGRGRGREKTLSEVLGPRGEGAYYLAAMQGSPQVQHKFPAFHDALEKFLLQPDVRDMLRRYTEIGDRASPRDLQPYFSSYDASTRDHGMQVSMSDISQREGSFGPSLDIHEQAARRWENAPKFAFYKKTPGSLHVFGQPNTLGHLGSVRRLEQRAPRESEYREERAKYLESEEQKRYLRTVYGRDPFSLWHRQIMRSLSSKPRTELVKDEQTDKTIRVVKHREIVYPVWDAKKQQMVMKRGNPFNMLRSMYREGFELLHDDELEDWHAISRPRNLSRYEMLQKSMRGEVPTESWTGVRTGGRRGLSGTSTSPEYYTSEREELAPRKRKFMSEEGDAGTMLQRKLSLGVRLGRTQSLEELQDIVNEIHEVLPFDIIHRMESLGAKNFPTLKEFGRSKLGSYENKSSQFYNIDDQSILGQIYKRRALLIASTQK